MKVISTSKTKFYEVTAHSCSCPDFVYRQAKVGGKCKHMLKYFYPETIGEVATEDFESLKQFKEGIELGDAYDKFGNKVDKWLNNHEICKVFKSGKWIFYLLEQEVKMRITWKGNNSLFRFKRESAVTGRWYIAFYKLRIWF